MLIQLANLREGSWWFISRPFFEESKILDAEDFGSSFFLLLNLDVLAQMHGKKEGKDGELQDCTLELRQFLFGDFGNDTCRNVFLLLFLWVGIFVGSKLAS